MRELGRKVARMLGACVPPAARDYAAELARGKRPGAGRTIRHTYLDEPIDLAVVDELTTGWYGRDWPVGERAEFAFLATLGIPAAGRVFNLGAHQGLVALLLKRKLVPRGSVVAVEMDRTNAAACGRNFVLNGAAGMRAVHAAVLDRPGRVHARRRSNGNVIHDAAAAAQLHLQAVPARTIDALMAEHGVPDLIYMDIEGAEVLAMRGAREALASVPAWYMELHGDEVCGSFGGSNRDVVRPFAAAGFALFASPSEESPFTRLDGLDALTPDRCHLIARRP